MALAVAMKEWLAVITSSPGPTPRAYSARCRAVVQLETAQANGAPTAAANASSNALTWGPWVTQPERIASRAAAASSSPRAGRLTGIVVRGTVIGRAPSCARALAPGVPPVTDPNAGTNRG